MVIITINNINTNLVYIEKNKESKFKSLSPI